MRAIAGAIIVLAGAVIIHADPHNPSSRQGMFAASGAAIGGVGMLIVLRDLWRRSKE